MVKIIVAFASDEKCTQFAQALESAGFSIFRCCKSASEVKRTLNQCGDAVLVSGVRFPDGTLDSLAWDLGKQVLILATGRPAQLELCEHPDIFRLESPCSKGELTSAVSMLVQLYQMRLPRRSAEDQQLVTTAKTFLMNQYGMTEPEAHRFLQKGAMDQGLKMKDYAVKILNSNE